MNHLFSKVFSGKTILVTGHTGFKGAWLTLWLQSLGARIIGYSLAPELKQSLFTSAGVQNGIVHIVGDVRDPSHLLNVFQAYQPDIVFHLAAQSLVRHSYAQPVETYATNIMGAVHLFEAIRATRSVRVCLNITSDKCYENKEWIYSYRENDPIGGFDPYSSSKGCAELVTAAYRNSFFSHQEPSVGVATVRAGNVIGGGDWAKDRIIPDCIRALSSGQPILVRNPRAVRPWQFVLEPLSGYLWLAACMWKKSNFFEGAWNFGPYSAGNITVGEIVDQVVSLWGEGEWKDLSQSQTGAPHEAQTLKLDVTKANNLLDWEPIYDVSEALQETIKWYVEEHKNQDLDVREYTLRQIQHYVQSATIKGAAWTSKTDE